MFRRGGFVLAHTNARRRATTGFVLMLVSLTTLLTAGCGDSPRDSSETPSVVFVPPQPISTVVPDDVRSHYVDALTDARQVWVRPLLADETDWRQLSDAERTTLVEDLSAFCDDAVFIRPEIAFGCEPEAVVAVSDSSTATPDDAETLFHYSCRLVVSDRGSIEFAGEEDPLAWLKTPEGASSPSHTTIDP